MAVPDLVMLVRFAVIARRWVIERLFTWINRNRRLAKDFETSILSVEAFLYAASTSGL
jgi:putative transposase